MTDYDTQITHYDCPIVAHFDDGTYVSVRGFDYRNDVSCRELDSDRMVLDERRFIRLGDDPWIRLRDANTAGFSYKGFFDPEAVVPKTLLMVVNAIGNAPGGWSRL